MGIRRPQRLRHQREFAAVYRRGRVFRSDVVVLRALRTNGPLSRFGFTAGSSLGNAVVRNKIKRRLREIVRSLPIEAGWDIVVNARSGAIDSKYDRLRATVADLMRRAGVLGEASE